MIGFIIVSHGNYSQGLRSAIEMIVGKKSNIFYLGFHPEDSPEDLKLKINNVIMRFGKIAISLFLQTYWVVRHLIFAQKSH